MSLHARFELNYPDFALRVNCTLPSQGIIGVFGRSGCGKTSLLRCIAGLEKADGALTLNGVAWQNATEYLPTHRRPLAYVFQEPSLFAHLTVQGNLQYAIKRANKNPTAISYDEAIQLFNIGHLLKRSPKQLSGGERQRVAIVRALLINPRLLLMDEPLAALDVSHKQEILPYLEQLHRSLSIPILYVSHALDEITRLADHLLILERGEVAAIGPLQETLSRLDLPVQLGEDTSVVIDGKIVERDPRWHLAKIAFNGGDLWLRDNGENIDTTLRLRILARDVSLALDNYHDTSILNRLQARLIEISEDRDEAMCMLRLQIGDTILLARITKRSLDYLKLSVGSVLWAQIKSVAIVR